MKKTKKYMTVNLQLFAEGDTNPADTANSEAKEVNNDSKQVEDKSFTHEFRNVFGLKDKEPIKKESEPAKDVDKKTDVKPEEKPVEKKPDEVKKPDEEHETEPKTNVTEQDKPEFDEILYNKEVVKIPVSDRKTYLQKGYNYDKVKADADNAKATLNRIAQAEGFKTVDEYLGELSNREKAKLAEQVEEAAGDPDKITEIVENHPLVRQTREERRKLDFEKAVTEISKDKFFKELEPEFNALMEQNPNTPPELVYKIIRSDYLTPEKINEFISKEKEAAKASAEKKVIAEVHDKERRTMPTGGDTGEGKDVVVPTDFSRKIAGIFGVSASKIAQISHEKMKRS